MMMRWKADEGDEATLKINGMEEAERKKIMKL
jgi:hypothetical protein